MTRQKVPFRFKSVGDKPERTKKWLLFPISIILHGLIIAAFIIQPLLNADKKMPRVQYVTLFAGIQPPAVKTPPLGSRGKKKPGRSNDEKKPKHKPKPVVSSRLVAPVEIPDEIEEEDYSGLSTGIEGIEGVEGSAFEGFMAPEGGVTGLIDGGDSEGDGPITVSSVTPPRRIHYVAPQYPNAARIARIEGVVFIKAVTNIYGKVINTEVVNGHPMLKNAAVSAVRQWIYEPYIINGVPKPVTFTAHVRFTLER